MRIAIISDIHGNYEALTAVLNDIYDKKVEKIVCLGDIVGYGPNPNECVQLIKEHAQLTIMGNHDAAAFNPLMAKDFNENARYAIEWTASILNPSSKEYLSTLSMMETIGDATFVHATPYDPYLWYYISSIEDARFNFNFFSTRFCFIGHTHIPGLIMYNSIGNNIAIYKPSPFDYSRYEKNRFIVNTGSVGQPRDRNSESSYVILNEEQSLVEFYRVPYDIKVYQDKMRSICMPQFLIDRVEVGR